METQLQTQAGKGARRRVLVVEDSRDMAELLTLHLGDLDCDVDWAPDGITGLSMVQARAYNLVVLDLMLPGIDGLEVCRHIRGRTSLLPILMLTAKSTEIDRVLGLEMGADDYLTKPFSIRELLARVKALFRRIDALQDRKACAPSKRLRVRGIEIDPDQHIVRIDGRNVDLTAKEFDLLMEFARNPGSVYTRSKLLDRVWGYGHLGYEHTVNSHINRLRAKIERDPRNPDYILTVWGIGYKLAADAAP